MKALKIFGILFFGLGAFAGFINILSPAEGASRGENALLTLLFLIPAILLIRSLRKSSVSVQISRKDKSRIAELETQLQEANSARITKIAELERLEQEHRNKLLETERLLADANKKLDSLGYTEYEAAQTAIKKVNEDISEHNAVIANLLQKEQSIKNQEEKLLKQNKSIEDKLAKSKELYKSVEYAINKFFETDPIFRQQCAISPEDSAAYDELAPSVILKLHFMDMKPLRKAYRDNDKQIESLLSKYSARYTTKANQTIYQLMVIALRAELQNILYNLKYEKLDFAVDQVKNMTAKYLAIASSGNQSIAGTLTKFIGEIEYLFMNAVKIEYNYYVKKEQARQEQIEIREKIKQETAERKALEEERKRIELEEKKYNDEIARVKQQAATASASEIEALNKRILELQGMLSDVAVKKEDIVRLQNGKAGNIYVISNLGSFGENIFKIGMTRRLDPQDRIDELGSASVPFKFDVHSFIFSENAVELEGQLHQRLNAHRVNKVNLRKEFFYSTVDELEALVAEIDPTAEFNKTMIAEEFRQSQSTDSVYTSEYIGDDDEL